MSVEIRSVIVASAHLPGGEDAVARLREGDMIELRREPKNKVDPNAIACYDGDKHVGYIPRRGPAQGAILAALDQGLQVTAEVTERALVSGLPPRVRVAEAPRISVRWE